MDDPKKFVLGTFFENVPKWSNSQSHHEKIHGSTLRKILEDFFKKSQVRNSHYLFGQKVQLNSRRKLNRDRNRQERIAPPPTRSPDRALRERPDLVGFGRAMKYGLVN